MLTGNWNSLAHNEILSLHAARLGRALHILTSVASEDGVYDLEEVRYDLDDAFLPERVRLIAEHLLDRTGVYDLHDLRGALTAFAADQVEA